MMARQLSSFTLFSSCYSSPFFICRCRYQNLFHRPCKPLLASLSSYFSTESALNEEQHPKKNDKQHTNSGKKGFITSRSKDFCGWFLDVVAKTEIADYGPVRGTIIFRPYGFAIWLAIQDHLNLKLKETGHSQMYFSQYIPYSLIKRQAKHIKGFKAELTFVTIGEGKEQSEKIVVRPTSETIVNYMFAQWIQSYRDLPYKVYQWTNATRHEMRTKMLLRNFEFLWHEGHTGHVTAEEAEEEALLMIDVYSKFAYEQAAMPVVAGRKSKAETFAGALRTYTIEAMMGNRKALQAGTSHNLGQSFSIPFGTQFTDEDEQRQHVWQSSWGISSRFVGGIIMTHGDDAGLILPPRMAPTQVVIIPIWNKADEKTGVLNAASSIEKVLKAAGIKTELDNSDQRTPGWKFNFWEMKGVPLRIDIGPRDVSSGTLVISRRDIPGEQGKVFGVSMEPSILEACVKEKLDEIQSSLLERATRYRDSNIVDVSSYDELKAAISEGKWARGPWSASEDAELKMKEEIGATIRCFPFEQPEGLKTCLMTGNPAEEVAIFAKAY